jgi:DNA mismatch endonuclease (patch repair protein)
MARVQKKGTDVELSLRKELHVPLLTKPRRITDIVFPRVKLAVFVDGCFWHGCSEHASWPKSNGQFWRDKIETNRARDADTDQRLSALGWHIIRLWAHERPREAAERIENAVRGGSGLE